MKIRLTSPTFDASEKTIVHASFSDVTLAGIQLIVNVTDQIIIYNFASTTLGGTLSTDTLTLEYDTTSMSDTDELMVLVEDGVNTLAVTQSGTWDEVGINDSGNAITVDWAGTAPPIGAGVEATALRVTVATDSTGVLSVDDNGAALTVDGTVTAELSAVDNAVLDTIKTDTAALVVDAAASEVLLGTIDADTGGILTSVQTLDNAVSGAGFNITQLNGAAVPIGAGLEATAVRVTVATDSTGVVSVDDNGGALTVDGTVAVTGVATEVTSAAILVDTGQIQTAVELIDDAVFVDDADWTADTSKHTLVGAVTQVATTVNTDGDTTPLTTNAFRELRVAVPESDLATATTKHVKKYYTSAGAATDGIIWSPAAGTRWYVTDIFINISAAATITLEDDLAGGDAAIWKAELAANSGWSHSFQTPWYSGEDAADLIITTTAGNVYVTVTGYEI